MILPSVVAFDVFGTLCGGNLAGGPYLALRDAFRIDPMVFRLIAMTESLSVPQLANRLKGGDLSPEESELVARIETEVLADASGVSLYPDTVPALSALKEAGIRYGLISNLATPYAGPVSRLLGEHGLLPPPELRMWSFDQGLVKPDAELFHRFAERAGVPTDQVLVVGDKVSNDLRGGRNAGCQSRLILRAGEPPKGVTPEETISSLGAVPRLVGVGVPIPASGERERPVSRPLNP